MVKNNPPEAEDQGGPGDKDDTRNSMRAMVPTLHRATAVPDPEILYMNQACRNTFSVLPNTELHNPGSKLQQSIMINSDLFKRVNEQLDSIHDTLVEEREHQEELETLLKSARESHG